jgi:type II secretory ATPase GspE/PulE/Tfp pilus assembly ATPase PilB-like protein
VELAAREEYHQLANSCGAELFRADFPHLSPSDDFRLCRPGGCEACDNTGYKERVGIHELLTTTDEIKRGIAEKAPVDQIRRLSVAGGMRTLLQDGIAKVLAGVIDMKQVLAVCSR